MDWVRFGLALRALRMRRRWRQIDLAAAAGCSKAAIWRIERGLGDRVTGRVLERVAQVLGARVRVRLDWNGEALDRLLDQDHAQLVEQVVAILRATDWDTRPEVTFAIDGERGSIDVLAWHAATATLLVIEVKSVVPDVQATVMTFDRKIRLAARIALSQGWRARSVSAALVVGEDRTSRRRIAAHATTFGSRFPDRIAAVRRFIASPGQCPPIRGLWFLTQARQTSPRHRVARPRGRVVRATAGRASRKLSGARVVQPLATTE
jgi:transcriptional regulator with XRE-family HTH domain